MTRATDPDLARIRDTLRRILQTAEPISWPGDGSPVVFRVELTASDLCELVTGMESLDSTQGDAE